MTCYTFSRLGGSCNHVAALLFKVDYAWQNGLTSTHEKACTSKENTWLAPTLKELKPIPVSEMVVVKPKYGKRKVGTSPRTRHHVRRLFDPQPSSKDVTLEDFADALYPEVPSAVAFMSAFPETSPSYEVHSDINVEHHEECTTSSRPLPPLQEIASDVDSADALIERLTHTPEEVESVEEATRGQHASPEWSAQRTGRITASICHRVVNQVWNLSVFSHELPLSFPQPGTAEICS